MSLLTINTLRILVFQLQTVAYKLELPLKTKNKRKKILQYPQCTNTANNPEVSWRWWNFAISGFSEIFDARRHGLTAAQWVRSDPEPAALQRHLLSKRWESCQGCIIAWQGGTRGGGQISAWLLWQFTGKKVGFNWRVAFFFSSYADVTLFTLLFVIKVDVQFLIMTFLSPADICRLGATSRYWRTLVRDPLLWRFFLLRDAPHWTSIDHVTMPQLDAPVIDADQSVDDSQEGVDLKFDFMSEWVCLMLFSVKVRLQH